MKAICGLLSCGMMVVAGNVMAAIDCSANPATTIKNSPSSFPVDKTNTPYCSYQTLTVDGLPRSGVACLPIDAPAPGAAPPVVLAFHGSGGCGVAMAITTQIHLAWPEAMVIYPDGIPNAYSSKYPNLITSSNISKTYTGYPGAAAYVTGTGSSWNGQVSTWQWILNSVPVEVAQTPLQALFGKTSPDATAASTSPKTEDLDFVNQIILEVAGYYGTSPSALSLYAVGHSVGSAFVGLLYNQSSGNNYPNFKQFKAFAFNAVAPDTAYDASVATSSPGSTSPAIVPCPYYQNIAIAGATPASVTTDGLVGACGGSTSNGTASLIPAGTMININGTLTPISVPYSPATLISDAATGGKGFFIPAGSAVMPQDMLLNAPAKPMLISLGCYDETIPYQLSFPSIIRARRLLGVTTTLSGFGNSDLPTKCWNPSAVPVQTFPATTRIDIDHEVGSGGTQLDVILHTEYYGATSNSQSESVYPGEGHVWPGPDTENPTSSSTVTTDPNGLTSLAVQFFQRNP